MCSVTLCILFVIATGDYATALKCYILAGAVASLFFEKDVPATVWSQQVGERNHFTSTLLML